MWYFFVPSWDISIENPLVSYPATMIAIIATYGISPSHHGSSDKDFPWTSYGSPSGLGLTQHSHFGERCMGGLPEMWWFRWRFHGDFETILEYQRSVFNIEDSYFDTILEQLFNIDDSDIQFWYSLMMNSGFRYNFEIIFRYNFVQFISFINTIPEHEFWDGIALIPIQFRSL